MADEDMTKTKEQENLIDVSEFEGDDALTLIEREEEDLTPIKDRPKRERQKKKKDRDSVARPKDAPSSPFIKINLPAGHTFIATMRERFSAFFIDLIILFYLYWVYGTIYCVVFLHSWMAPIPYDGWHATAFHGSFLFICFLYYFILEGIFLATVGKFICWMSVRRKDGEPAGLISTFVRNLIRPIDYILILPVAFLMELTKYHQRIGDLLGASTVVKKFISTEQIYEIEPESVAPVAGRFFAVLIDLALFFTFVFGYVLTWNPDSIILSQWLLLFLPLVMLAYFIFIEMLSETTPGKWLLGYISCQDNGRRMTIAGSLLRTIWRIFDTNPLGMLAMLVSSHKQRPGDLVAGTVVIKHKRTVRGVIGLLCAVLISGGTFYLGSLNKVNILSKDFKFTFLPKISFINELGLNIEELENIQIQHFRLAANEPNNYRSPPTFMGGEVVYLVFEIAGYTKKDRGVWLQEDLSVRYPDGTVGLNQKNIVDYRETVKGSAPIEFTNNIALPQDAAGGTYEVLIKVRDMLTGSEVSTSKYFYVRRSAEEIKEKMEQSSKEKK